MKGDIIILEEHHIKVAHIIVSEIIEKIKRKSTRYILTVSGESGSGKSETALAIAGELLKFEVESVILGQDDYCHLPPKANDIKRKEDPDWLGPHMEIKLDLLEENIKDAVAGKNEIMKPLIDYNANSIGEIKINLAGIKVVIAEGTYASLLKTVDTRIFIARNRLDTLEHRKKRNRGNEVNDSFTEQILITEHKIIAGHKHLADIIVTNEYDVLIPG